MRSCEARWPSSSTQAVCQIDSRARWMSMALPASMGVAGQHERHALVHADLLAERLAGAGVVGGDVLGAVG
jgi:hypothetical protein